MWIVYKIWQNGTSDMPPYRSSPCNLHYLESTYKDMENSLLSHIINPTSLSMPLCYQVSGDNNDDDEWWWCCGGGDGGGGGEEEVKVELMMVMMIIMIVVVINA